MGFLDLFKAKELSDFDGPLSREKLITSSRIAFIDDETPLLLESIRDALFSVDHDTSGGDLIKYDTQLYDVAIIDYYGVGLKLGEGQGLDVMKYIKRVSPRTRLIAYTSRSLNSSESEFFRLSHVVLPKDMGLGDSLKLIEDELQKAFSKQYLFEAMVTKLNLSQGAERERMHKALYSALN